MNAMIWQPLRDELDRWEDAGIAARLWLRDDDATDPSAALDRLAEMTARHRIPAVIAIIPANTGEGLAEWMKRAPHLAPAIHGWAHVNHAPAGEKKQELGLHRGHDAVLDDLRRGFDTMARLYGERLLPMLVPPWNRIDERLISGLPQLGYRALSAFGEASSEAHGISLINTHVDLIDFRGTRRCHDHGLLVQSVADELARSRQGQRHAAGILSHHLVDDDAAFAFLDVLFTVAGSHPACRWVAAADLVG